MDAYLIINIIIIILISGLSIAVLAQNYRKSINIIFVVFAFSVSVWIISNYFSNSIYNPKDLVIIANYLVFFFSYLAALSLLKIAIIIANDYKANKIYNIMLIPSLIVGMLSFSKLIVIDVVPEQDIYAVIFGPLIGLYGIFLISILSSLFYVVYINRKRATKYNKSKLNILYISLLLSMPLLIITQFILPTLFGWFGFTNIGIISMLILVIGLYYGVIKHKLFDLKFVVIRSISYAIALIILSLIYGTVSYFLSNLLSSLVPKIVYTEILNIILIAAAVSVYGSLVKLFNKLTNKIFFREAYDPQTLINEINSIIVSNSSLDDSLYNIINIIKDSLKIEYIEIFDSYENIKYISSKTNSVKINDSLLYKLKNNKDKIISSDDMVDDYNLSLKL